MQHMCGHIYNECLNRRGIVWGEFGKVRGQDYGGVRSYGNETRLFGPQDSFMDCELNIEALI